MSRFLLVLLAALVAAPASFAQLGLGADLMSRYVWRGYDFGESLSIQPYLDYTATFEGGSVTVGTWASYSVGTDFGGANEHDLYISASVGPVSFGVTDYYFPTAGGGLVAEPDADVDDFDFFDYENAHLIEPFVSFDGVESFPISLYAAAIVYGNGDLNSSGDQNISTYLQASYALPLEEVELGFALGVVPMESAFYLTDGFAVVNVTLSASREVAITEDFGIPVMVGYTLNPELERTYLVFGISL
ncbi:MAG: hypothetical protein AAGF99_12805 [Bacteroidota bacterium]